MVNLIEPMELTKEYGREFNSVLHQRASDIVEHHTHHVTAQSVK